MPDFGDHLFHVVAGYAAAGTALGVLVWASLAAHARAAKDLKDLDNE